MRSRRRRRYRQRKAHARSMLAWAESTDFAEWDGNEPDDWDDESDHVGNNDCHYCGGDGYGIVGLDWDCDDGVNGPYDGEVEECPCCHGSGKAEDCTFW